MKASTVRKSERAAAPVDRTEALRPATSEPVGWLSGNRRLAVLVVAAVVLLAGAGTLAWYWSSNRAIDYADKLKSSSAYRVYQEGVLAASQQRYEAAAKLFTDAIGQDPKNALIHNALATVYVNMQEYQLALLTCEKGVVEAPGSPDLYYTLGLTRFQLGKLPEAEQALVKALDLRPVFPNASLWLGQTYMLQARSLGGSDGAFDAAKLGDAIEQFEAAVAAAPDEPTYHAALGEALYDRRDLAKARAEYERAVALSPKDADYLVALGKVCDQLNDLPAAQGSFQQAAQFEPQNIEAWYGLGIAYFKNGQDAEAVEALQKALKQNPYHADAHEKLAQTFVRMGRQEDADSEVKRAAESRERDQNLLLLEQRSMGEPTNLDFAHALASEYAKRAEYDKAFLQYQRILSLQPDDIDAKYQIAGMYFNRGKIPDALNAFTAVNRLHEGYRDTNMYLGQLYRRVGQTKRADDYDKRFRAQQAERATSGS